MTLPSLPSLPTLRSYRIAGMALFDLVFAALGTVFLFLYFRGRFFPKLSKTKFIVAAVLLTVPIGIVFHVLFGVDTSLNYRLGLSNKPN